MEGNHWVRLGLILLLTLGSVWVLAPTFLDEREIAVETGRAIGPTEPPLEVWFEVADGEPDEATIAAVSACIAAAGLDVVRVAAKDGRVTVFLPTGARKLPVAQAVAAPASVQLFAGDVTGVDPAKLAAGEIPDELLANAVRNADLTAATPLPVEARAAGADAAPTVAAPVDATVALPVIVAVGTTPVGYTTTLPTAEGVPVTLAGADLAWSSVTTPALPEPVTRWVAQDAAPTEAVEEGPKAPEAWYASLLPPFKLNPGLDLQGGIDLTLQVDQEAAVLSVVQRDRRALVDAAKEAGKTVDVRRDRTRFALQVHSAEDFSVLSEFVDEQLRGEYIYIETVEDDGTWHVWELVERRVLEIGEQAVEQNLETLRKRVDATGVKEPSIVKMGGGRINIQLPGVSGAQAATDAIGTQATLEFRAVDEDADQNQVARNVRDAERQLPADQFADLELLNEWLRAEGKLPEGRIVMFEFEEGPDGDMQRSLPLQLVEDVVLTGGDVDNAAVRYDQNNFPRVILDFKPRGANVFCDYTKAHVGQRFAIILDDQIRSAPNIREAICGGTASIEMGTSATAIDEASTLALVLRTGALTAPVDIGEIREIGASLGADAISAGTWGAALGGAITLLFMGFWYRTPGLVADVALLLNVLLVFAALAVSGATVTLPGIAGVALTIGMAVDANIIIYERIREELKLGVTARKAVETGYEKGLSAVLDANVTTFIAGVVLFSYGTGPIKGFAVTLMIGIGTTLVTALFVTRTFMEILTRNSDARLRI